MLNLPFPLSKWIFQRFRPLQSSGRVSIGTAVSIDWTTISSYQIGSDERAYILGYGYDVQDPLYDWNGSLLFRLLVNGNPVRDFSSIQLQHGTIQAPAPALFYLQPSDLVSLQARRAVASSNAQFVLGRLTGFAWPQRYCIPFDDSAFLSKGTK